jgi:hypothetical protein
MSAPARTVGGILCTHVLDALSDCRASGELDPWQAGRSAAQLQGCGWREAAAVVTSG